jgi:hypothetical protein
LTRTKKKAAEEKRNQVTSSVSFQTSFLDQKVNFPPQRFFNPPTNSTNNANEPTIELFSDVDIEDEKALINTFSCLTIACYGDNSAAVSWHEDNRMECEKPPKASAETTNLPKRQEKLTLSLSMKTFVLFNEKYGFLRIKSELPRECVTKILDFVKGKEEQNCQEQGSHFLLK